MVDEIAANLYKIDIPLPGSPLKSLNAYVIRDRSRNLIIDTGMNREECKRAMDSGLEELGVDLRETDFLITHLHSDHLGLASHLVTSNSTLYFNQPDADRFSAGISFEDLTRFALLNGFPQRELQILWYTHPGFKFRPKGDLHFTILKDGDTIRLSDYLFRCVETPGHTKGHMGLYEPKKKIFIGGDHILADITPNIQLWSEDWDPLNEYLTSLEKVYWFDIELLLPGHRSMIKHGWQCKGRIEELKNHNKKRLAEIISILEKGGKSAFQVASEMRWDL